MMKNRRGPPLHPTTKIVIYKCRLKLRKWITTSFIGNEAQLLSLFPCAYGRINIYLRLYRPFRVLCFYTKTIIASDAYSTVMIISNTAL